jgi:uracil-DNA glycosylase
MDFPSGWAAVLPERTIVKIQEIERQLEAIETAGNVVYPPKFDRYKALKLNLPGRVSVCFIGQDPYHGAGQAMGLSFSVPRGVKIPPSLRNIYKELNSDCDIPMPNHGDLTRWAEQGCLLLNTSLSVLAGQPGSHKGLGWSEVTAEIVCQLSIQFPDVVFVLWGKHAQELKTFINPESLVIESSHPSPIGGSCNKGFFGSRPFSRINTHLASINKEPIDWALD